MARAEHFGTGDDSKSYSRFVVTSRPIATVAARARHEDVSCARGELENQIKEQQLMLFADRAAAALLTRWRRVPPCDPRPLRIAATNARRRRQWVALAQTTLPDPRRDPHDSAKTPHRDRGHPATAHGSESRIILTNLLHLVRNPG